MGCYNSWANLRSSSCSPLGEKSLWNGTIGLIGLLSSLLCAGLLSWGTYHLAQRGCTAPVPRPSKRDHQAVLCKAFGQWAVSLGCHVVVTVNARGTNKPLGLTRSFIKSKHSISKFRHANKAENFTWHSYKCSSHCHKMSKWYDEPLICCHWVKIYMQFCHEQTRTRLLFSPACTSATYGSSRMSRRKNNGTNNCWFPLARKWLLWKWTWIWIPIWEDRKNVSPLFRMTLTEIHEIWNQYMAPAAMSDLTWP